MTQRDAHVKTMAYTQSEMLYMARKIDFFKFLTLLKVFVMIDGIFSAHNGIEIYKCLY